MGSIRIRTLFVLAIALALPLLLTACGGKGY
jgi:predicted small lipoprotein YifL